MTQLGCNLWGQSADCSAGNLQYLNYTAEDVFWGELGGLMEAVDGGTTMIVDHAHMSLTPDRSLLLSLLLW